VSDTIFITEPKVYLIAETGTCKGMTDFLDDIGTDWRTSLKSEPAEDVVEFAGRVCYMSFGNPRPGGNEAYIKHILEVGHGSVLEHASFSLLFTGVSRSLTHETIRHRAGFGYSQLSQRYVDESDCAFVVPPELLDDDESLASWMSAMSDARLAYMYLVDNLMLKLSHIENKTERRKKAREAARSVLPNATETKIVVSGNARAWRHWLHMRGSEHADAEIRRLAGHVLPILKECAPNIFMDCTIDASGVVTVQHQA
jgi:thymidylate synthase (FAD)